MRRRVPVPAELSISQVPPIRATRSCMGGSVIIIALLHAASNGAGIALLPRLSPPAPPSGTLLFLGLTVVVFPVLILIFTRGRLGYNPERHAHIIEAPRSVETALAIEVEQTGRS